MPRGRLARPRAPLRDGAVERYLATFLVFAISFATAPAMAQARGVAAPSVEVRIEGSPAELGGTLRTDAFARLPANPAAHPSLRREHTAVCPLPCVARLRIGAYRFALADAHRVYLHARETVIVDRPGELHLSVGIRRRRSIAGAVLLVSSLVFGGTAWIPFARLAESRSTWLGAIAPVEAVAVTGLGLGAGFIARRRRLVVRFQPIVAP